MTMPDHVLRVLGVSARSLDLTPTVHLWDEPPQTLPQLPQALQHEWQNINNVLYNECLLPFVTVAKLSSGLVVVITETDILATPM